MVKVSFGDLISCQEDWFPHGLSAPETDFFFLSATRSVGKPCRILSECLAPRELRKPQSFNNLLVFFFFKFTFYGLFPLNILHQLCSAGNLWCGWGPVRPHFWWCDSTYFCPHLTRNRRCSLHLFITYASQSMHYAQSPSPSKLNIKCYSRRPEKRLAKFSCSKVFGLEGETSNQEVTEAHIEKRKVVS